MYKKIYFDSKPLIITDVVDGEITNYRSKEGSLYIDKMKESKVTEIIKAMQKRETTAGIILHNDVEAVLKIFKKNLLLIQAAGGFIYYKNEVLLIFRREKWDLPKGKLEDDENLEDAAIREVKEETGITKVQLEAPLCITYHTYYQGKDFILKESHWYIMRATEKENLAPQVEEDIEQCEWVNTNLLSKYLQNTHHSIKDVIKKGLECLNVNI
jgi:8-oxo-dGTP pyrophosphatase MutT (NUDIX family)